MRAAIRQEIRKAAAKHLAGLELDFPAPRQELEEELYYLQRLVLGKECNKIYRKKISPRKR